MTSRDFPRDRADQPRGGAAGDDVASPCVNVCEMDAESGLCRGCARTIDEIAVWSVLDPDEKRAVLAGIALRKAARA